jgi:hypothetical protein
LGFWLSSARFLSAGGQDEQLWDVNSSITMGASVGRALSLANGALEKFVQMLKRPKMSAVVAMILIM